MAFQSFRQSQDLLAAINTLLIHLKLNLAGIDDRGRAQAAEHAKNVLAEFLGTLAKVVGQIEKGKSQPLTGVDPRLRQLATAYVAARRRKGKLSSEISPKSLTTVTALLFSTSPREQQDLLESLSELRSLLEDHISADASLLLADF